MKSPLVRWLLALNILVLCGVLLAFFSQKHHQQQAQQALRARADRVVQAAWKDDDATLDERARLHVISESIQREQPLTDGQLSLLLTEMSKPNERGSLSVSSLSAAMGLEAMHYRVKAPLSPSQRAIFSNRLVSLLQVPDATDNSVFTLTEMHKLQACHLLALYDVREAIPQIVPLLDDPKAKVRNDAKQALMKLGYRT